MTVDIDPKCEPNYDPRGTVVRDIDPPNTWKAGEFDVVWCSPPCTFLVSPERDHRENSVELTRLCLIAGMLFGI